MRILKQIQSSVRNIIERHMMAIAFAEEGMFDTAQNLVKRKKTVSDRHLCLCERCLPGGCGAN